jgi:hypothetical protein
VPLLYGQTLFVGKQLVYDPYDKKMKPADQFTAEHISRHVPQSVKNVYGQVNQANQYVLWGNPVTTPIMIAGYVYNKAYQWLDNAFSNKKARQDAKALAEGPWWQY